MKRANYFTILATGAGVLLACSRENPVEPEGTPIPDQGIEASVSADEKQRLTRDLGPPAATFASAAAAAPGATSIPFAPEPGPFAHTAGVFCDDCTQTGLPIGFAFTFFGSSYTTFNVSSNGFIGFGPSMSHGCCSGGRLPSNDGINNIIAAAWTDLYPPGGGVVNYETRGRAPNRYLIVAFQSLPWCCESGANRVTTQIILYEGSNAIEIHTANQSVGHIYTQGVEDATGTRAAFIPGRVAANYGYVNDAVRFTTDASWLARAPLPSPRRALAVWAANGQLYAIGGVNSAGTTVRTVQAFSPSSNSWVTKAPLPAARQGGNGAVTITNTMYLAGGYDAAGVLTRTLYAYNASTNTWSSRANMPVASGCGGSGILAGKIYVFSGCTRTSAGTETAAGLLHRYDPATNSWTTLRAAPVFHVQPTVAAMGGKLYVIGGNNGSGTATGRVDMYDPATNSWSLRASMPTPRVGAAGAGIGGKFHVFGGRSGTTYFNTVQAYDPVTNSWSSRPSMPTARATLGVGGVSGFLYAVGGRNSIGVVASNERFTP